MSKRIIKKYRYIKILNVGIVVENKVEPSSDAECWTRRSKYFPVFTLKISIYVVYLVEKIKTVIYKLLEKGRKSKNEGCLYTNSMFIKILSQLKQNAVLV